MDYKFEQARQVENEIGDVLRLLKKTYSTHSNLITTAPLKEVQKCIKKLSKHTKT